MIGGFPLFDGCLFNIIGDGCLYILLSPGRNYNTRGIHQKFFISFTYIRGYYLCVLIVLIYLLMFVTCLSPDKHVDHEFYKNMVLIFSVLIGWSLVAIKDGSVGVYLPIVALSIKTAQNHVLF